MITYAQYFEDSNRLHDAYYEQFDSPTLRAAILARMELRTIRSALEVSPTLNTIPLPRWDAIAISLKWELGRASDRLGGPCTLSTGVCAAKAVAKKMAREVETIS